VVIIIVQEVQNRLSSGCPCWLSSDAGYTILSLDAISPDGCDRLRTKSTKRDKRPANT
jgi:hypothetical protein